MVDDQYGDMSVDAVWVGIVSHLVDLLGDSECELEEMFGRYAYLMETYYPDFRLAMMAKNDDSWKHRYRLILQRGFPVSMSEFEAMVEDNDAFMRPYEISLRPRFLNDYGQTDSREGNIFDEGCAAHIPICSKGKMFGWLTLSSKALDYRWSDAERQWLPVTGRICGAFINMQIAGAEMRESLVQVRKQLLSRGCERAASQVNDSALDDAILRSLTRRELEVISCLGRGMSNAEISEALLISESTTRKHVENIFAKLGVKNRTQAALVGQRISGVA